MSILLKDLFHNGLKLYNTTYIKLGEFYFTDDTCTHFAEFINRAYKERRRVVVEFNEGWENFSGYHGGNGLKHSFYVGKSTGVVPLPLTIYRRDSSGGCQLITCSKAIKNYYFK